MVLAGFVLWEWHRRAPLLDPRVFAHRGLAAGSLSIFVQFFALFGFIFIVLQYLQLIRGDSGLVSAVSMLPMAAAMLPSARLAPALVARLGARTVCAAGLALIAAALAVLAQLTRTSGYWLLAAGLIPLGAGMGLAMTPATSRHHLGPARLPPGSRIGAQRPVPRDRRRGRHRGDWPASSPPPTKATFTSPTCPPRRPARPGHRSPSPPTWAEPSPPKPTTAFTDGTAPRPAHRRRDRRRRRHRRRACSCEATTRPGHPRPPRRPHRFVGNLGCQSPRNCRQSWGSRAG